MRYGQDALMDQMLKNIYIYPKQDHEVIKQLKRYYNIGHGTHQRKQNNGT
jgi:urease accessory protein UreE